MLYPAVLGTVTSSGSSSTAWRLMTLRLVALPQAQHSALSPAPRLGRCPERWERARRLALVPVWSRVVPLERGMLERLATQSK